MLGEYTPNMKETQKDLGGAVREECACRGRSIHAGGGGKCDGGCTVHRRTSRRSGPRRRPSFELYNASGRKEENHSKLVNSISPYARCNAGDVQRDIEKEDMRKDSDGN